MSIIFITEARHTYNRHKIESHHTFECVMSHMRVSHVTLVNLPCRMESLLHGSHITHLHDASQNYS